MHGKRAIVFTVLAAFPLVTHAVSWAQTADVATGDSPTARGGFHADAEVDPTAYILEGFSIHVGLGWQRWRLDLGNFAMAVPHFVHGNSDYDVSFDGYGAKLQYFLFEEQSGGFVGVDGGINRMYLERKGTDLAARQSQYSAGVDAGWRFPIVSGLYATIWAGLGYTFHASDVTLADSTYKAQPWTPFAALHVGYRFR